ncbi:MAG: hypothetical protein K5694_04690 [Bacilli bacterium]|nr:hypothetical protein [Bacilli bacterium]
MENKENENLLIIAKDQYAQVHHELQEMIAFVVDGEIKSKLFPNGQGDFEIAFDLMLQKSLLEIAFIDGALTQKECEFLEQLFEGKPTIVSLLDPDKPRFIDHLSNSNDLVQRLKDLNAGDTFANRIAPMYMNFAYIDETKEKDYSSVLMSFMTGVVNSFILYGADFELTNEFLKEAHMILKANFFDPMANCSEAIGPFVKAAKAMKIINQVTLDSSDSLEEQDLDMMSKKDKINHSA